MMLIKNLVYRVWFVFRKGVVVLRRDGLVKGLSRGWEVLRKAQTFELIEAATTLFDIKGRRYTSRKDRIALKILPDPQVSIIIPVLNGLDYVRECIDSLYASRVSASYEVIAIDQKSTDGTRQLLRDYASRFENFALIENPENVGFARAMNQGASIAKGQYLVLANSDLIFTHGWLDPLLQAVQKDPEIGIISPVTNYVGEGPQLDPEAIGLKSHEANAYAEKAALRDQGINVVDRLVFFCVLIRKNIYDLLGGLANIYALGNYEDDDFCLRARLAGYKLQIARNSFVFHYGSKTFIRQKIDYKKVMQRNEKIFFQRVADFTVAPPLHSAAIQPLTDVSVIIRTKDRPFFLKQALASLANQTYRNFEAVIVNDGFSNISHIVEAYQKHLCIKVVQNQSKGRGAALNRGLAEAKGPWITYLDDDDLLYPTHLENLVSTLSVEPQVGLAYTDANKSLSWVDEKQEHFVALARERFDQRNFSYDDLLFDNWIPIMSYMHRLEDALLLGGYDETLEVFEDWDFLLRLTKNVKVYRVPRITCEYRLRFGKQLDDSTLRDREKALAYRKIIYERYPVQDQRVIDYRELLIRIVSSQLETVQKILSSPLPDLQKNFLVAASLGGFPALREVVELDADVIGG